MKVVIVAKTRMGSGACIGGLTFEGRSLRLLAADRATNDRFNMDYQVGEVWEIETRADQEIIPPHVENVIVHRNRRMGPMSQIDEFIARQMPPISGGLEAVFEGLTQATKAGSLYIAERTGVPARSTMFWQPDQALTRDDDHKRIRYRYPTADGGRTLTLVGFQEPLPEIPAGTLMRISLAHWWRPEEMPEGELRCYVQISGWFPGETESPLSPDTKLPARAQKQSYAGRAPQMDDLLQQVFGYPQFRPLQREIITQILSKQDTLAVMPTGSGKSLCYQLPAILFPGLTVVVSPLISLMEDQVLELKEWGIPAAYLNSTLTHSQYLERVGRIKSGETKLLYAAPETLLRPETIVLLEGCPVDCLVIDEAHCISEWGHDFRPEYRQLAELRGRLPEVVTLAVTATATRRVRQDIKTSLVIADANEFISSFDRQNLVLSVDDKIAAVVQARDFLDAHPGQAGIIYCATRDQVDVLTDQLAALGYPVLPYHAGMDDEARRQNQRRFRFEDGIIMVATIAFGMGINKPNVRFILHYDLPKNIESYYQQIGRAGRDGLPADCLVLYSYGDVATIRYFIRQESPNLRRGSEQRLESLLAFMDTLTCRRTPLLDYFGETYPADGCEACDNCLNLRSKFVRPPGRDEQTTEGAASAQVDLSIPARQLLTCAQETREIFGMMHLIDVLRGSKAKKILNNKHDQLPSYGVGVMYSKGQWRHLAGQFVRLGLLKRTKLHGSLVVTDQGKVVLQGESVFGEMPGALSRTVMVPAAQEHDPDLFEQLRALRATLARERSLPPYVIFHDRALIEMSTWFPRTPEELPQIYGVGQRKVEQYGPHFLPVIQAYCKEKGIEPIQKTMVLVQKSVSPSGQKRTDYVWEKYQAGAPIPDIAADMGFTQSTILKHLNKAFSDGRHLRIDGLTELSELSEAEAKQVIEAFDEFGTLRLKPIFEALDQTAPYDQLHIWRLIYQVSMGDDASGG
ncbi:MAG: DNA helicase RecQ [Anaerolineales bacterium]|nr:DNA helicase RecQ [Anaerolineales bacterium]